MGDVVAEADLADPNPDVQDLFQHYDRLYFRGALADAGFIVKWGSLQSSRLGLSRSWLPPTCGCSLGAGSHVQGRRLCAACSFGALLGCFLGGYFSKKMGFLE
jgi:hypothetical protein